MFMPFLLAPMFLRAQNTCTEDPPAQNPPAQNPPGPNPATENPPTSIEAQQAQEAVTPGRFAKRTFGPGAWVMAGAGSGIAQGTDTPSEWGQGAAGYGRRFASSFGKHIVSNIIRYPVAHFRHEELVYHPSGKHGFGARLKYAMLSTFITHKTTTCAKTIYTAELSGAVGSGLISRLWQPASTRTIAAGFSSAGTSLAVDMGIRVLREFWPDIRHPHRRNAPVAPAAAATARVEPVAFSPETPLVLTFDTLETADETAAEAALCER